LSDDRKIPAFQTEADGPQWWFDHRDDTAAWIEKAAAEGQITTLEQIRSQRRPGGITPMVSIRIDPSDLERARVLAQKRGLRYQTYLKMLLHDALERKGRRLAHITSRTILRRPVS
jgi:hypothetical protein